MTLMSVGGLGKHYGAELIFENINFQVARGDKVALVGVNGAGKSTLLKIIGGIETPDAGQVAMARGLRVAYLAQEVRFSGDRTLWQEMEEALKALAALRDEISALEPVIADTAAPGWEQAMERYGELTARFEHMGGYEVEPRIKRTLQGLGFHESQYHQRVAQFSGGQKTRAALAATLLSDPDLLLLDEPTNHLDMHALEWLEQFLRNWDGTLIVISHDRYFLDRVTKRTLEIAFGKLEDYPAPYNKYLELKAERMERRLKEFQAQQEFIAKTEEFIRRYKAGQRAREAKGREKRLERLKRDHGLERPKEQAKLRLFLDSRLRSGELVLALDGLVIGFPGDKRHESDPRVLLRADGLEIHRGDRVALLGPNGAGKTTLLRTLIDELKPLQGAPRLGHKVHIGYYAQGHDVLNWDATVLEELTRVSPTLGEPAARNLLGRFLFSGDDVFKRVGDLSGGERSRVALAQLTLLPGNLLILDEPTNHLDIGAREALEGVLKEYPGSILFVSHDRYFIDAIADKVWNVENGRVREYIGGYSDFVERRDQLAQGKRQEVIDPQADATPATPPTPMQPRQESQRATPEERQRKKRLAALEAEVALLEQELGKLKTELERASAAQDIKKVTALGTQYAELEQLLASKYDQWEQLAA
jgi:ATP-binding cassette subfamily F protein 3